MRRLGGRVLSRKRQACGYDDRRVPLAPDLFQSLFSSMSATRSGTASSQTLPASSANCAPKMRGWDCPLKLGITVEREVFEFEVSGLKVVQSWLSYRMKKGAGKKSSPLDYIRPERWTSQFTTELLELLRVLEATVEGFPEQARLLEAVINGDCLPGRRTAAGSPTKCASRRGRQQWTVVYLTLTMATQPV